MAFVYINKSDLTINRVALNDEDKNKILSHIDMEAHNEVEIAEADCIGFLASFAIKFFGYNKKTGLGSLASLKFYDSWIFPLSKILDSIGFKYLFGKNLILIASKK